MARLFARDANGEIDFGHVDSYTVRHLIGDFGEVEIVAPPPQIETRPSAPTRGKRQA
jgi:hypothetical protein